MTVDTRAKNDCTHHPNEATYTNEVIRKATRNMKARLRTGNEVPLYMTVQTLIRDHRQITTNKMVALGRGNPSVSLPRNGERTRPGSFTQVIHGQSIWRSY